MRPCRAYLVGLILAATTAVACIVEIDKVKDPTPIFRQARAEALRCQKQPGQPHELNVLVYDPTDRELVRVSVPMWLVRKIEHEADKDGAFDLELGGHGDERIQRAMKRLRLRDLEKAGRGVLVEVEEDDGEQVLVWLR